MKATAISWQTLGHDSIKQVLGRQLALGVFPHAYLFIGPEGVGKKFLAKEFAARLLNVTRLESSPDYYFSDAGADDFDIATARALMDRLTLTPMSGQRNVAIIDRVQQFSPQTGNAFLKTLEEPAPQTMLILVADNPNVLPTVKSRCQVLNFGRLGAGELAQFAAGLAKAPSQDLLDLSCGSPGRLDYLLNNQKYAEDLSALVVRLEEMDSLPLAQRFAAIGELAELEADFLRDGLQTWLFRLRSRLQSQPKKFSLIAAILESLKGIDQSLNRKLVLQRLLSAA